MKRMQAIATTAAVLLSFTGGLLPLGIQGTAMPVSAAVSVQETGETEVRKCGDNLTWEFDNNSYTLTIKGSGDMWDFGADENKAPWPDKAIMKLVLPSGLTSIGSYAFTDRNMPKDFALPAGLKKISDHAFYKARFQNEFTLPDGLTGIGESAFYGSTLVSCSVPDTVTEFGDAVFNLCESLTTVKLPKGLTEIPAYTFGGDTALTAIDIPETVTAVGERAFINCVKMNTVTAGTFRTKCICSGVSNY